MSGILARGPFDRSGLNHINRLPMSSIRRAFDISLDGRWEFQLRESDTAVPLPDWSSVTVPDLWSLRQVDGERPHYTNVPMPFPEAFPEVPEYNPLGVYRREVELEPESGKRLMLHIGAAEGFLRVAVNGNPVGTSGDSHLAAEFDITDFVVPGTNFIELAISKWTPATYLEDQDQWWLFGLSRSVGIISVPDIRLADLSVVADFDAASSAGSLRIEAQIHGLRGRYEIEHSLRVTVLGDEHDVPIAARFSSPTMPRPSRDRSVRPPKTLSDDYMDIISMNAAGAQVPPEWRANPDAMWWQAPSGAAPGNAVLEMAGLSVTPWSSENPHLETLMVELLDTSGTVVDSTTRRIGFRRITIAERELRVNDRTIPIQGVNRHDIDPKTGRIISRERMLAELTLLKRLNVNAIRTSHYPNAPEFLDLCDEMGFYVVDEADVESHAFASTLAGDPLYLTEIVERVSRMVVRDRNHPSVIIWSLGNESGYHAAHDAAAAWVRAFDPTRVVQYEGAVAGDWYEGRAASDIACPMYPSWASLEAYSANPRGDRPLIPCEYAYSQGNSTGGFAHYWELFETLPGLQGGFIWEFLDHALDLDESGRGRYGGDFGDIPNNGATFLNGIVFADLTPKPAAYEIRTVFSPARIASGVDDLLAGRLVVRNRRVFMDLSDLDFDLRVDTRSGEDAVARVASPDAAPGQRGAIEIPPALRRALETDDALGLTVIIRTRHDSTWAPAGTEISTEQLLLSAKPIPLPAPVGRPAPLGDDGDIRHRLLASPPKLSLWRALTDNDLSAPLDQRFVRSGLFSLDAMETEVVSAGDATEVTHRFRAAFGDELRHRRRIVELGLDDYLIDEQLELADESHDLLRVGVAFELIAGFDSATWIGRGPWENYDDRHTGTSVARWERRIDDLEVPYLRPQENGSRSGTTALLLDGPSGRVRIDSEVALHINVARHSVADLESVDHWWELPPRDTTHVHLDIAHRGMGTGRIGPDTLPEFRVTKTSYGWRWRLRLGGPDAALSL